MSNRAQITQQAARDGVPAPTVERDYVLAHVIAAFGALGHDHGLVFKGGTALRLCYFEDYRYSADLDFSVVEGGLEAAYATIEAALTAVTGNVETVNLTDDEPRRIAYRGHWADSATLNSISQTTSSSSTWTPSFVAALAGFAGDERGSRSEFIPFSKAYSLYALQRIDLIYAL